MDRIYQALPRQDAETLRLESHSFKRSVAFLGAAETSAAAARLEELAQRGLNLQNVDQLHSDLQSRVGTLLSALKQRSETQPTEPVKPNIR